MPVVSARQRAFLARGLSLDEASLLEGTGIKISLLRSKPVEELVALGLTEKSAKNLRGRTRPPIPPQVVNDLIFRAAATCCVCQTAEKPFIFHHIQAWEEGGGHDYENLVLLCLEHHDHAHRKGGLAQQLSGETIRSLKAQWTDAVAQRQSTAINEALSAEPVHWDYVNHNRLFELMLTLGVPFHEQRQFGRLRRLGIIASDGVIQDPKLWSTGLPESYLYDVYEGLYLHDYIKGLLSELIPRLAIRNVSDPWTLSEMRRLSQGAYIVCDKAFYCRRLNNRLDGRGQDCKVYRHESGIELSFQVDLWEATSSSSRTQHLAGHRVLTPLLRVTSVIPSDEGLEISASCLAITGSAELRGTASSRWELDAKFSKDFGGPFSDDWDDEEEEDDLEDEEDE